MAESRDVDSLNLSDLDVESLERRLELVEPGSSEDYYCGTNNCDSNLGTQEVAY